VHDVDTGVYREDGEVDVVAIRCDVVKLDKDWDP
jgi:hypothetical protein